MTSSNSSHPTKSDWATVVVAAALAVVAALPEPGPQIAAPLAGIAAVIYCVCAVYTVADAAHGRETFWAAAAFSLAFLMSASAVVFAITAGSLAAVLVGAAAAVGFCVWVWFAPAGL